MSKARNKMGCGKEISILFPAYPKSKCGGNDFIGKIYCNQCKKRLREKVGAE